MAPLIASYQAVLYHGRAPVPLHLAYSAGVGLLLFFIGYAVFYRHKFTFAEVV
ncbi:hypothetical protein D3C86_2018560 [compost metagenome]